MKDGFYSRHKIGNPLSIIALLIGITELSFSLVFSKLPDEIHTPIIWFMILFPVLYTIGFFLVLFLRPQNFYGPSDFRSDEYYALVNKHLNEIRAEHSTIGEFNESNSQEGDTGTAHENVLAVVVEHLDPKVCWYLLKVADRSLTYEEHRDYLLAEMKGHQGESRDRFEETLDEFYSFGYLHGFISNNLDFLFRLLKQDEDKLVLQMTEEVKAFVLKRLGLH